MPIRMKTGLRYLQGRESQANQLLTFSVPLPRPRLWMVLLILALPFIIVSENYFEALERTGPAGAVIADVTMPAVIIGYLALVSVLKKRKL